MFEFKTNLTSIINVLKDHNTTTASPDLSGSLTSRIVSENILADDPEIVNVRADALPAIFVRINKKDENFSGIGNPGSASNRVRKECDVLYDIIAMYRKEGGYTQNQNVMDELYTMTRNIESVLNSECQLSNTALWSQPISAEYFPPMQIDGSWVKTVLIQLKAHYLYR